MTNTPKKDLKYFMREQKEEIVTAPAPESFVDADSNRLNMEIRVLSHMEIQKINDNYRKRGIATNPKGSPYIGPNNEVVLKTERDSAKASRHIMVEALVFPKLDDPELMKFYNCVDKTDMPLHVFSKPEDYSYVNKVVMEALGLSGGTPSEPTIDTKD